MSKIVDLKAYQLSELAKEHSENSIQVEAVLSKVEKIKELDLKKNFDQIENSLSESISLKLLDHLDSVFKLMNMPLADNLLFLKKFFDLKPNLVSLEMELMAKIEQELLAELNKMIDMVYLFS